MSNINELVVISGKGGTGKTTVTAALAELIPRKVIVDTDVDAANLHILLKPEHIREHRFVGKPTAHIDHDKCTGCGLCESLCRFNAISSTDDYYQVDSLSCEGCQLCFTACPEKAIHLQDEINGLWFTSQTKWGDFVYARLNPGGENSGSLVTTVRREAYQMAGEKDIDTILIDGPPGVGCPVIAAISNTSLAVIVVEPTYSGISDLKRVHRLTAHFKIRSGIVINRWDVDRENSLQIESFAEKEGIPVYAKLPYSPCVRTQLMNRELPVPNCEEFTKEIKTLYSRIKDECKINL